MRGRSLKEAIIFLLLCKNNRKKSWNREARKSVSLDLISYKEGKTYLQNKQRKKIGQISCGVFIRKKEVQNKIFTNHDKNTSKRHADQM